MAAPEVKAVAPRTLKVVNIFGPAGNNLPSTSSIINGRKWVELGRGNTFPEYCMAVIANCAPLAASAQLNTQFLTGLRYEPLDKDGKVVEKALVDYNSWFGVEMEDGWLSPSEKEFRMRVMSDIAHLSAMSVDVVPSVGQSQEVKGSKPIRALYHRSVVGLRVGKPDEKTGRISDNYWSANWEKCRTKRYEPIPLPVFNPNNPGKKITSIYRGLFRSGDYFLPRWLGALADAENWASIAVHNKTQADAGFSVRTLIILPGNKDQVNLDQVDEDIERTFTGPNGKPYMVLLKGNTGDKADIVPLERGDKPGESEALRDKSTDAILTGYGMPKVLLGIDIAAGMGGAGLALEETWTHFLNTSVVPSQELYTDMVDGLLRLNGHTEVVRGRIVNSAPYNFTDKALKAKEYLATTMVNDALKAQGKPELPPEDKRGTMMLGEIGLSYNLPQLLDQVGKEPAPAIPPANG